jgi:hypothetical protein
MARKTQAELLAAQRERLLKKRADDDAALDLNAKKQRALDAKARATRVQQLGRLAWAAGLGAFADADLAHGFALLCTLVRRGHLAWAIRQATPDPDVEREVQALIDNKVTLVLVDEDGPGGGASVRAGV